MAECSSLRCPNGTRIVQTAFNNCECVGSTSVTSPSKSLSQMIDDALIQPIKRFLTGSPAPAPAPKVTSVQKQPEVELQRRGIFQTRGALDKALENIPPPDATTADPPLMPTATTTNQRGGTHNPIPEKSYTIFGHTVSIPENMVIPVILAITIVLIILAKRLL